MHHTLGCADQENSHPAATLWLLLQAVTFKWLARRFSVPVNEAKQMLFAFAEKHRYPACCGRYQAADSLQAHRDPCTTMHSTESAMHQNSPALA